MESSEAPNAEMDEYTARWAEPTLRRLRRFLPYEPSIAGPEDLAKAVDKTITHAILRERENMWSGLLGKQVLYEHPSGLSFWVRLGDGISMYVIRAEKDDAATRFVLSHLTQGGTFLDVGANTGWFTLRAAARYRDLGGGAVHAFEPQPVMADLIKKSIEENHIGNYIQLHDVALGNEEKSVWMATPPFNSGGSAVRFRPMEESFEVRMVPLDDLKIEAELIDIVKVDIEGSEPLFMEGAADFLRRYRPKIYSELHPTKLEWVSKRTRQGYVDQMAALGYRVLALNSDGQTMPFDPADIQDPRKLLNVVFEPE